MHLPPLFLDVHLYDREDNRTSKRAQTARSPVLTFIQTHRNKREARAKQRRNNPRSPDLGSLFQADFRAPLADGGGFCEQHGASLDSGFSALRNRRHLRAENPFSAYTPFPKRWPHGEMQHPGKPLMRRECPPRDYEAHSRRPSQRPPRPIPRKRPRR